MKTRRGSKQMMKVRPVIGWLMAVLIVGLEFWTVCGCHDDPDRDSTGRSADLSTPVLTAPVLLW